MNYEKEVWDFYIINLVIYLIIVLFQTVTFEPGTLESQTKA